MTYLLDTDACIGFLRKSAPKTIQRLAVTRAEEVGLSAIVLYESLFGAFRSARPREEEAKIIGFTAKFESIPFDKECARVAGEIRADLGTKGTIIGPHDILIASIAKAHQLILIISNVKEFERVAGLRFGNWEA